MRVDRMKVPITLIITLYELCIDLKFVLKDAFIQAAMHDMYESLLICVQ